MQVLKSVTPKYHKIYKSLFALRWNTFLDCFFFKTYSSIFSRLLNSHVGILQITDHDLEHLGHHLIFFFQPRCEQMVQVCTKDKSYKYNLMQTLVIEIVIHFENHTWGLHALLCAFSLLQL
jgi:hypothetical protein